ncbi:MAG: T9SS type A sorting domain-containing protein [Bacteroidetes bacterium]|nr:T9SS type A sorting domain-containing protein [Bacteroidota bacterium]MCL1968775.1 T9SS type A sorting domain-containing protein [Bacteroidota bacterium]
MKKLLTLIFVGFVIFGYAQKFQLTNPKGTPYTNGETISSIITENDLTLAGEFITEIKVENLTATELDLKVSRTNLVLVEGMDAYVCFGACFPSDVFEIDYLLLEDAEPLTLHLVAKDTLGTCYFGLSKFKLDFTTEGQSMTLFVEVDMQNLGVKENNNANLSLSAYPNPVSVNATVNISYKIADNGDKNRLVIRNIMGAEVMSMPLNPHETKVSIDVSTLVSGVYFYAIENKNQISIAKKLIIK